MGTKYIHLIRHGQFHIDENHKNYGSLTTLGRYQAKCTAKRLNEYDVSVVHISTVKRAQETGEIILGKIDPTKGRNCKLIVEGIPEFPEALIKKKKLKKSILNKTKIRMNKAFKKYFKPNKGKGEKHEALVCHGNIIRYLVVKSLGVETIKWINFDILQCSISTISIDSKGKLKLITFGEAGHIPLQKRTYV